MRSLPDIMFDLINSGQIPIETMLHHLHASPIIQILLIAGQEAKNDLTQLQYPSDFSYEESVRFANEYAIIAKQAEAYQSILTLNVALTNYINKSRENDNDQ